MVQRKQLIVGFQYLKHLCFATMESAKIFKFSLFKLMLGSVAMIMFT